MLSGYTCLPSIWDRAKCGSSTTMQVWTFAWTSLKLLLFALILALVPYSVKLTTWLISVCLFVTVSLLTVCWWSTNGTLRLWLQWSERLLLGASSISLLSKGYTACSAFRAAVLMMYTLPAWVATIRIDHILGNGTANPGHVCSCTKHG